jgi:hypothetical protein
VPTGDVDHTLYTKPPELIVDAATVGPVGVSAPPPEVVDVVATLVEGKVVATVVALLVELDDPRSLDPHPAPRTTSTRRTAPGRRPVTNVRLPGGPGWRPWSSLGEIRGPSPTP